MEPTQIRIPYFQHNLEIRHLWATFEEQLVKELMLRVLSEIEKRLKLIAYDSSIETLERDIKPKVDRERTLAIKLLFQAYREGATNDSFTIHVDTIWDSHCRLMTLIQKAFFLMKNADKKQMSKKKSIQKAIVAQVLTKETPYYTKELLDKLNDVYREIVDNPIKTSKKSRSFTSLPTVRSPNIHRKKLHLLEEGEITETLEKSTSLQNQEAGFKNPFVRDYSIEGPFNRSYDYLPTQSTDLFLDKSRGIV